MVKRRLTPETVELECQEVLAYSEEVSQKLLSSSLRTDRLIDELVTKKTSFNVEGKLDSIELRKRLHSVYETRQIENTKEKMAMPKLKKDQKCDEAAEIIERFNSAQSFNDFLDRVNRQVQD